MNRILGARSNINRCYVMAHKVTKKHQVLIRKLLTEKVPQCHCFWWFFFFQEYGKSWTFFLLHYKHWRFDEQNLSGNHSTFWWNCNWIQLPNESWWKTYRRLSKKKEKDGIFELESYKWLGQNKLWNIRWKSALWINKLCCSSALESGYLKE